MNMDINIFNVIKDLAWSIMADKAGFMTSYGGMVFSAVLDKEFMKFWIAPQKAVTH